MENIKAGVRRVFHTVTQYDPVWYLALPLVHVAKRFAMERESWVPAKIEKADQDLRSLFAGLTVADGPFRGLKYPNFIAHGSYLYPKLIGSYEQELHPVLEMLCSKDYSAIVDIGCAEGYYAVGLALRQPQAKVYAYDIDEAALESCRSMAKLNNVDRRMVFGHFCSAEILRSFDFGKRGLIVCDCEGYELELFNEQTVENLRNCDLLVELHDCLRKGITQEILRTFARSHTATLYSEQRRNRHTYSLLQGMNRFTREYALNEGRPGTMQWVYLAPKSDGAVKP